MADVGAAEMWEDPDFGTRSYSTRIQGSNAQIREVIGEVFTGMAWRPSVSTSRDEPQTWSPHSQLTTTEVSFFPALKFAKQGTMAERLK